MKRFALPLAVPFLAGPTMAFAAAAHQPDAARLHLAAKRLQVVGSVLYIAAHPDDENTRLLAYLANELLLRTAYLSITRGDGGQNLIGTEQGDPLGVIRTQELLAARRVDGAEQLFTRARDFGYSKTPDETLSIWDRQKVLADVVWAIRRFRPDVVITRFPTNGGGGHGHHTASALLAEEAFDLAADPKAFPEQLAHVQVWKARRLVYNLARWDPDAKALIPKSLQVELGGYNAALGQSYGELSADSRSNHKSQGFGAARQLGPLPDNFILVKGEPFKSSLFDGLDLTWSRFTGTGKLRTALEKVRKNYSLEAPHASVPGLLEARALMQALPDSPEKRLKLAELDGVIAAALGLVLDARAETFAVAQGEPLKVTASAISRSPQPVSIKAVRFGEKASTQKAAALALNAPLTVEETVQIAKDARPSAPYWLWEDGQPGLYDVRDPLLVGTPENAPALSVSFDVEVGGQLLTLSRPVEYVWVDPVDGEKRRSLEVTPRVMVNPERRVLMLEGGKPKTLTVRLEAGAPNVEGTVRFAAPEGFRAEPATAPYKLAKKGDEAFVTVTVSPEGKGLGRQGALKIGLDTEADVARGLSRINHPHIPIQALFPKAEVKLQELTVAKAGSKIGYVPGAGDLVADSLRQVGYAVTELSEADLAGGADLSRFDAIVVGVRAYNVNERLAHHQPALLAYVERGGTLLVQYSTQNHLSSVKTQIGPYPFTISRSRVTDENAAVTKKDPKDPLWSSPNALTDDDFRGWVQERGLYFAEGVDPKYVTPLSMNDPGEKPHEGALLVARHGKGTFLYTGLSFFRQLPAGVPGAYRLFANLLAHGKTTGRR